MTAQELWAEYLPKLDAARERDRVEQQGVFLTVPESVGGIWLQPLTIKRFLLLEGIEHPILTGKDVTPESVASFCYLLSPEFKEGDSKAAKDFIKNFPKPSEQFSEQFTEFIKNQLQINAPESNGNETQSANASWVCSTIDLIASEYGWSESDILDLPIRRAFAYGRAIANRKSGSKSATFNKNQDAVKGDYLKKVSELRK